MENQAGTMSGTVNAGADALQSGKEKIAREIGGMVNQATDVIREYGGRQLGAAKETFTQAQSVVSDAAKQYADITDEYVRANPWKALGVAAAAGVLVGILLTRR